MRYRLDAAVTPSVYCCHCRDCQTWSGSAFTQQAVIAEARIAVTDGEPVIFERVNHSGAVSTQHVCGACHTRLWNTNSRRPGTAVVCAGTLEESGSLTPRAHIWVKRKQPWIVIGKVPSWPENAPLAEFVAALKEALP